MNSYHARFESTQRAPRLLAPSSPRAYARTAQDGGGAPQQHWHAKPSHAHKPASMRERVGAVTTAAPTSGSHFTVLTARERLREVRFYCVSAAVIGAVARRRATPR